MGHEPRFNCTVWVDHPERMTQIYLKLDNGEMPTREEITDFGEFTGGLNTSEQNQANFVPVGYKKEGANFVPVSGGGAPGNYPVYMDTPMWGGDRKTGVNGYPALNTRVVTCIPITIPKQSFSETLLKLSVAEYGTAACAKQASLSRVPGDFVNYLSFGQGNTAEAAVTIGKEVQPGETVYFSIRFWSVDTSSPGTDDATAGVSIGGAWPR